MKKQRDLVIIFVMALILLPLSNASAQQKRAQTGLKFLSVSLDARVSGMGEATTASYGNSSAMLYNPAGMSHLDGNVDFSFGQTSWIADINYIHATAAFKPFDGQYGVVGVTARAVDYGEFLGTIRANNEQGFLDVGTYSPIAFSLGLGYARSLSEKFSIGANIAYVHQDLGTGVVDFGSNGGVQEESFSVGTLAFDFGLIYETGFKSLNIGMSVKNFSQEVEYIEESFQLPLNFTIGMSFNFADMFENIDKTEHSLLVNIDTDHPRDFSERVFIGGEYLFMQSFALRAGYSFPQDERGFSAGAGVKHEFADIKLGVDYAYAPFGVFENVHRITVKLGY